VVLNSLNWHRQQGRWRLYAWVLMPHHLHAIVKPPGDQTISSVLQSFGSFTAHATLHRLRHDRQLVPVDDVREWLS
jgi:REP element-mobilizing transposase RayT